MCGVILKLAFFPPKHDPSLARYQSWWAYARPGEFRARWVGRIICMLDSTSIQTNARIVLAKLALVLLASFLRRPSELRASDLKQAFQLLGVAVRSAGRSRPCFRGACKCISEGLRQGEQGVTPFDCVIRFLRQPAADRGSSLYSMLRSG